MASIYWLATGSPKIKIKMTLKTFSKIYSNRLNDIHKIFSIHYIFDIC